MKLGKIALDIPPDLPKVEELKSNGELYQRFEFKNGLIILAKTGKPQAAFTSNYVWHEIKKNEWAPDYNQPMEDFIDVHYQ